MSYESYYIEAALDLGLIQKTDAEGAFIPYGFEETITSPADESINIEITAQIEDRAKFLSFLSQIREVRNDLLKKCDWVVLEDVNLTAQDKQTWLDYRQALRDCTDNLVQGDEETFTYPQEPFVN